MCFDAKEPVLNQRVLKTAGVGQQFGRWIADNRLVVRLVGGAFPDGLVEIAKRIVIGGGFKLAKAAQGHHRAARLVEAPADG
jgi:hypothetical protein